MDLAGLRFDGCDTRRPVAIRSALVGRPNVYNMLAAIATAIALGAADVTRSAAGVERHDRRARPLRGRVEARRRRDGGRRLRAHRRCAAQPARDGAAARDRPRHHGVRLRRRSRPHQAAADGHGGGAPERRGRDHLRQPAQRGSAGDHRRDRAGHPGRRARPSGRTPDVAAIVDRAEAIEQAVRWPRPGDVVLVAGKGHEKYQHIGDRVLAVRRRRRRAGGAGPPPARAI